MVSLSCQKELEAQNNDTGEELIAKALEYPTKEGWEIAKIIFPDIGEYVPPPAEEPPAEGGVPPAP